MTRNVYLEIATLVFLFSISFVFPIQNVSAQQPTKRQIAQAKKFAEEGDKFFRQKNYKLAIDRYDKASALVPNVRVPALYYYKGYAHYNLGENEQAVSALTTALDQGYTPLEIYKIRWYIYYQNKNYDGALADLEAALKVEPDNSSYLIAAGDIYRAKSMYREAVQAYEKAVLIVPDNADLNYLIALCYAGLGDFVQQGVAALKAVQKNTRYLGESWFLAGSSFQLSRKYPEAAEAYEKAISAKPELVDAFNNLSQVYQILNRYDDAIAVTQKGLKNNPNDGNLYTNLSWYYSLTDRNMDAIAAAKKAIAFLPNQSMGYTNLCRSYNEVKAYEQAIEACNNALKISPNDGETNFYIARAYDFLKKPDIATGFYEKSVKGLIDFTKDNPDYADGFYLLGNAYYAVGQRNNAITAYKQCLGLSPKFVKAIYNLGYMYVLNKDKASAQIQYNALQKLDPGLAEKLLQAIQN